MLVNFQNTLQLTAIKRRTTINVYAAQNGNAIIQLHSLTGQAAVVKKCFVTRGNNTVESENMNAVTKGIYIAVISVNGVAVENQKIIAEE